MVDETIRFEIDDPGEPVKKPEPDDFRKKADDVWNKLQQEVKEFGERKFQAGQAAKEDIRQKYGRHEFFVSDEPTEKNDEDKEEKSWKDKIKDRWEKLSKASDKVTTKFEKLERRVESFASSIREGSPSVQIAEARREIIKLQADMRADRIAGPALHDAMVSGANKDAAWQQVQAYFNKWFAKLITPINEILELLYKKFAELLEKLDGVLIKLSYIIEWVVVHIRKALEFLPLGLEKGGDELIKKFFDEWRKSAPADEFGSNAVHDFFTSGNPLPMQQVPANFPRPFNLGI